MTEEANDPFRADYERARKQVAAEIAVAEETGDWSGVVAYQAAVDDAFRLRTVTAWHRGIVDEIDVLARRKRLN